MLAAGFSAMLSRRSWTSWKIVSRSRLRSPARKVRARATYSYAVPMAQP
jgi:hypothetical protein